MQPKIKLLLQVPTSKPSVQPSGKKYIYNHYSSVIFEIEAPTISPTQYIGAFTYNFIFKIRIFIFYLILLMAFSPSIWCCEVSNWSNFKESQWSRKNI